MEWTEELIARLRDLWSQGLSTAEIGRQLSITKNAVVGKAHRLELPPRPSPIRNRSSEDGSTPARKRSTASRKKKTTEETAGLPLEGGKSAGVQSAAEKKASATKEAVSSPSVASGEKVTAPKATASRAKTASAEPAKPVAPPRKMAPPRRVREAMDRATRRGPSCQWPHGDPGTPGFHFCGATPLPGKPYCAEHAAIAYVKIRDRRH